MAISQLLRGSHASAPWEATLNCISDTIYRQFKKSATHARRYGSTERDRAVLPAGCRHVPAAAFNRPCRASPSQELSGRLPIPVSAVARVAVVGAPVRIAVTAIVAVVRPVVTAVRIVARRDRLEAYPTEGDASGAKPTPGRKTERGSARVAGGSGDSPRDRPTRQASKAR